MPHSQRRSNRHEGATTLIRFPKRAFDYQRLVKSTNQRLQTKEISPALSRSHSPLPRFGFLFGRLDRMKCFVRPLSSSLLVAAVCHGLRPIDNEESKHASKFRKILSGLSSVTDMVLSLLDPSRKLFSSTTSQTDYNHAYPYPTHIQVQFAGLGRTGTTSLASAMSILGYKVLHDDEAPAVMDLFGANYRNEISVDELHYQIGLRGFNCSFLWHDYEWSAKQENVLVVLNGRDDVEKWVDSWLTVATFYDVLSSKPFCWIQSVQNVLPFLYVSMVEIPTGGHPEKYLDRETLLRGYQLHYDNVRAVVPPERLLEYNVKEGWEPLCNFLNLPIPNEPVPHINDRFKVQVIITTLTIITWIWPILFLVPTLLISKIVTKVITGKQRRNKSVKQKSP